MTNEYREANTANMDAKKINGAVTSDRDEAVHELRRVKEIHKKTEAELRGEVGTGKGRFKVTYQGELKTDIERLKDVCNNGGWDNHPVQVIRSRFCGEIKTC